MNCICCGKELRLLTFRDHNNLYCSERCKSVLDKKRSRLRRKEEKHFAKKPEKEKNVTRWSVYFDPGDFGFNKGAVIPSIEQTLLDGNLNPGTILRKNREFYLVCGVLGHSQSLTVISDIQVQVLVTARSQNVDTRR